MYHYLIGPAVGAVIGYITNDIAIRMLFRPHQAKYIMGIHVPFTPGIIPKEKARIAGAIGKAVSENLMNREVLEKSLLSDDMLKKISNAIDEFVTTQSGNDETIEQFALHYLSSDDINAMRSDVTGGIIKLVTAKLQNSDLGSSIAHMATEHVMEKTRNSLAGRLGAEMFIQPLAQPIEKILAKHINEILQNNSQQMIQDLVNKEASELMGMTMSQLTTGRDEQVEQIKRGVLNAYRTIIIEHLPRILQDIDISTIIEQRINEMDMNEAEAIIMDVMKKELRAIVWLGALLGCIMGTINALI
ncbi:MAG: DUF445 family protein [Bacteroidales bacterium]|nr:DUF445 family protein [Bacteroidales bacterium]